MKTGKLTQNFILYEDHMDDMMREAGLIAGQEEGESDEEPQDTPGKNAHYMRKSDF